MTNPAFSIHQDRSPVISLQPPTKHGVIKPKPVKSGYSIESLLLSHGKEQHLHDRVIQHPSHMLMTATNSVTRDPPIWNPTADKQLPTQPSATINGVEPFDGNALSLLTFPGAIRTGHGSISGDTINAQAVRLLHWCVNWTRHIPAFCQLPFRDQAILLEESWSELFVLGAAQFGLHVNAGAQCAGGCDLLGFNI